MSVWEFMDYVSASGQNRILDWYEAQELEAQVAFDQTVYALRRIRDWHGRWQIKPLTKTHAGLWQVRFKIGRAENEIKYRPVGIVTRDARVSPTGQFVLLLGCQKKLGQYSPPAAFDEALELKRDFEAGRGDLYEHF